MKTAFSGLLLVT